MRGRVPLRCAPPSHSSMIFSREEANKCKSRRDHSIFKSKSKCPVTSVSVTELPEMEFPRKAAPRSNEGPPIIFFAHPSIAYDAPERVCRLRRRCAVRTTMKTAATKRNRALSKHVWRTGEGGGRERTHRLEEAYKFSHGLSLARPFALCASQRGVPVRSVSGAKDHDPLSRRKRSHMREE